MDNTTNTAAAQPTGIFKLLPKKILITIAIVTVVCIIAYIVGILTAASNLRSQAASSNQAIVEKNAAAAVEIDLANELRTSAVDKVLEEEAIPAYSVSQIMQMDVSKPSGVTLSDLKQVSRGAFVGLEEAFLKAEKDYGINCLFVMAIAAHESANGTMCYKPNNMFGYGGISFDSKAECIDVVSKGLARNYLSPSGSLYCGKTISSVNKKYAASTTWDDKVARNMANYYSVISKHHNKALEELK